MDLEGSAHGISEAIFTAFAWQDWGKPLDTSLGFRAKI
jgi:hypothetical protein